MGRLAQAIPVREGVSLGSQGDGRDLARMLAKIAHAYAVAELGLGSFTPFLTDIILALQLPFCFEVRALSGGLMSSTPA
jgi:hypothetical protein